uniref:Uncharacterized protein LOC113789772 n=1 Tax=Dermatophagoides pteronyssinus TaxID=6956 RepID=A0A6P6XNV1_DERPT|nr:uncharacterized protein LOC113789772 [Dermatophagoides pteronyssinus]
MLTIQERIKRRRSFIFENANHCECDVYQNQTDEYYWSKPPDWFEPGNFQQAQKLFRTYKSTFILSYIYGLSLSFFYPDDLIPLISTGKSKSVAHLFQRYLKTIDYISIWFELNPFDEQSKAYRTLSTIRQMHSKVSQKLNKNQTSRLIWMNQYRMYHGQFPFVGLFAIFPKQLGFDILTQKEIHCIFHFWRTIGYCLGIDDQFNLCSGTDQEIIEICQQIFQQELLPTLTTLRQQPANDDDTNLSITNTARLMSKGLFQALGILEPFINYNIMMRYACKFVWKKIPTPAIDEDDIRLKNFPSRIHYIFTIVAYRFFSHFRWFHWLSSRWLEYRLKQAKKYCKYYTQCLERMYPNHIVVDDDY